MKYLRTVKSWTLVYFLYALRLIYAEEVAFEGNTTTAVENSDGTTKEDITFNSKTVAGEEDNEDINEGEFYDDYDEDNFQVVESGNTTKPKPGIVYAWTKWPKWNKCSRPCGGGVQVRIRNCIEKKQTATELLITQFQPGADGRKGCFGVFKKYRMCNQKACAKPEDFRDQQCAAYNNKQYKGKLYTWEGYTKEHHECELNCKPIDLNVYTTLSKWVIDGTPCSKPSIYYSNFYRGRAVCVEGICRSLAYRSELKRSTWSLN